MLKYLANDPKMSVVLVGTGDAVVALQTERADDEPVLLPIELPRWSETAEFRRFLNAFERLLPLRKPSQLAQREVVQFVLAATGGITGAVAPLLNRAAEAAIRDRTERVTLPHLEHAAATIA